ncbi:MAG: TonB-dependent receptor [Proteobacteria bacterium]|nr:TonB-dependent receptor [Pseudomonadota bacterium]
MTSTIQARPRPAARRNTAARFRLSPVAAAIAAVSVLASGAVHAQEKSSAELQSEIARLKQALEKAQQELQKKDGASAPAASAPVTAEPAAAPVKDEPVALDSVVIRSRNRIERLQDVPLSVAVVTGRELDRTGADDIKAITQRLGNISWNQGNQRTSSLSIRGIGKQGQTEAQDPSVGVIVDGVNYAYNALTSSFTYHDIEAVEVTRGPQGTLLGKNTSLGVVNITTRKPSFTPSADYSITLGQNDRVTGKFAGGGPLIDDLLAWRGSFVVDKGEGDIRNLDNKDITYQNIDRVSGRVQFLLTPTQDFNARLAVELQPRAGETTNGRTINTPTPTLYSNGAVNTLGTDASTRLARSWFKQQSTYNYANDYLYGGGHRAVNNDTVRPLVTGSHGASLELNWNVANHTLTSITAYKDYHFNAVNDDGTPFDIYRNAGGFWNDYKQRTQELRISSKTGGFVDYQAGLYYINVANSSEYQREWGNDAGAWFASTAQYNRLNTSAAGQLLMQNSLDRVVMAYNSPTGLQNIKNTSSAIFAQANWHLSEPLTLTTGLRLTREDRSNTGSSFIRDYGNGAELNPVAVNGVQLGGFASSSAGVLAAGNSAAQLAVADKVANKYFGVAVNPNNPGAAYNSLTAEQKRQVADAKAIRATQVGVLFNQTQAASYRDTQPAFVVSPSYKVNPNLTTYFSWQYGEKAGISQLTNGVSNLVKAEKTNSFELGLKSTLLDKTLVFNTALYFMNIRDYQQSVRVLDQYTTSLNNDGTNYYTSATGNVPKVQAKGIEVDGVYAGIRNVTLRFSGAYNDARYKDFTNAALPNEENYPGAPAYKDLSGQTLPGASKWNFNIGADYRRPVFGDKEFHASFNTVYYSRANSDNSLSSYSWIPDYSITDLAIGIGRADKSYDVSLLVKNAFGDSTPLSATWNSYTPALPRWVGVMFTGKL